MAPRKSSSDPAAIVDAVARRLQSHADKKWPQYGNVEVRRRGSFVYVSLQIDADSTPDPLCRLRNLYGGDLWEFSHYSYASEKYEPAFLPTGEVCGTLEECFDCAALTYVNVKEGPDDDFAEFVRAKRLMERGQDPVL